MTVTELRKRLEDLENEGKGDAKVIWQSMHRTWDIEFLVTTRNNLPVVLVNP